MIPGVLISLLTFPGVIVHEAAHMLFCKLRGVAVLDVCFFRVGNPAGYVFHETPDDFLTAFLISVGPLIVNSLLCIAVSAPAFVPVRVFELEDPLSYFLLWLGVSIGMHAFPSNQDARILWDHARRAARRMNPLALATFPLVIAIYVANFLSVLWFDYAYGIALAFGAPELLLKMVG